MNITFVDPPTDLESNMDVDLGLLKITNTLFKASRLATKKASRPSDPNNTYSKSKKTARRQLRVTIRGEIGLENKAKLDLIMETQESDTDTQSKSLNTTLGLKLFCNKAYQNLYFMVNKFINSNELLESLIKWSIQKE